MKFHRIYYPEIRFGGFTRVDGTIVFYSRVNALLRPSSVVVDVGCGRGAYAADPAPFRRNLRILRGKCRKVIGLDVNPENSANPFLDEFRLIEGDRWPVEGACADICLSDNVLEHVENPDLFFSECNRLLEPGGMLCIRTPNVLSYFGLISRVVPAHKHIPALKALKNTAEDAIFPTLYRCNTVGRIRRMLEKHGFEACVYGYDAEPSYLSFSRFVYYLGVLHQRFAPDVFKVGIHAFGRKT